MTTAAHAIRPGDEGAHDASAARRHPSVAGSAAAEFLTFTLGAEEYGIEILKVREIRRYDAVTRIANSPAFIKGVINLRGTIVPVVDLRIKFDLAEVSYNDFTVMIVLSLANRIVGIVVDSVSDVVALEEEQIKPPPEFGSSFDARYLLGLGAMEQRMLILLDIEQIMTSDELALVDTAAAQ